MKRILSLLIIMTMLIAVPFPQVMGAEPERTADSTVMAFMAQIGVVDITNEAMQDSVVTREDFAVYVANLLGVDTGAEATVRYFTDVSMTSYGAKAISALVELGVISRAANDVFRPDDNITLPEAVKMLCEATGYGLYCEQRGGYPSGYLRTANENDFLTDVVDENAITVKEAAEMIYEAAQISVYEPVAYGNSEVTEYSSQNGNTLFSIYHDIYFDTGLITGVYGRTMNFDASPEKGYMSIDNEYFLALDSVNRDEYLGDYAKYFYKQANDKSKPQIIFITDIETQASKFAIKDLISYEPDKISYYTEDSKQKSKSLANPVIVYNGYPVKTDVDLLFADLNKGYITLKDTDGNRSVDLVLIDDYYTVVASGIDANNMVVYNELDSSNYIDCDEYTNVKIYDSEMNLLDFEDLKIGTCMSAATTRDNKELLTVIVSGVQLNGNLESVSEGKEITVEINGKDYVIDKNYADEFVNETKTGNNYYYLCDFMGEIVYVSYSSTDSMSYAYVIKSAYEQKGLSTNGILRVLDSNGKIIDLNFADNIKVDGVKYKGEIEKAYKAFLALGDGAFKESMIRYTLNEDGEIKEIDTPFLNTPYETDGSSLTPVFGYEDDFSRRYFRDFRLGLKAYVTPSTPVYGVPLNPVYGEIEDNEVTVKTVNANPVLRSDAYYVSNAYVTNKDNEYADVIAVKYSYDVMAVNSYARPVIMIDRVTNGIDNEGNTVKILKGYRNGNRVEYEIDNRINLGDISQGDLIRLYYSIDGKVIPAITSNEPDAVVLYDYSLWQGGRPDSSTGLWKGIVSEGRCYLESGVADTLYYNHKFQLSFGFANEVIGDVVRIGYASGADFDEAFKATTVNVVVYDKSLTDKYRVYKGTINDIRDYQSVGDDCSTVLVHTYNSSPRSFIIYK